MLEQCKQVGIDPKQNAFKDELEKQFSFNRNSFRKIFNEGYSKVFGKRFGQVQKKRSGRFAANLSAPTKQIQLCKN